MSIRFAMRSELTALIKDLERCAKQNESDAKTSQWITFSMDAAQARAVAAEQRRMIGKLRDILRDVETL